MRRYGRGAPCLAALALLGGAMPSAGRQGPMRDIDWQEYGRVGAETHDAPDLQISPATVGRLGPAWYADLDVHGTMAEPIEAGGRLFVAAGLSIVHAFDVRTGRLLWRYDPEVGAASGDKLRYGWGIRGATYTAGKVIVGTHDGRLIALDATTGRPAWTVDTVAPGSPFYITGAPRVMGDLVVIGNGGADFGGGRGYVTAYDVATGRQRWRFFTVPGDPAKGFEDPAQAIAARTWSGRWWENGGGGGTVWDSMTYDAAAHRIYLGVGNGAPWNWKIRNPGGGDGLFLASIVALDARTGAYRWHYQVNPNEGWDFSAASPMILADLTIGGRSRRVLMQAPKNGFFYVLDRDTGKLISAEKLGKVTWAERIDLESGRPVENPTARYAGGSVTQWPSFVGLHDWQPMAFSARTGLVYIPVIDAGATYSDEGITAASWKRNPGVINSGLTVRLTPYQPRYKSMIAWDPVARREAWSVPAINAWHGGTLSTDGGLVFQGQLDGSFNAYDARTGQRVWTYDAGVAVIGTPITYSVAGRQYVSVIAAPPTGTAAAMSAYTGIRWDYRTYPRRLLTFALDKRARVPALPPRHPVTVPPDDLIPDRARVERGAALFGRCSSCHGMGAVASGAAPDLRASPVVRDAEAFDAVVRGGALTQRNMPRFAELTVDQLTDIRHYIGQRIEGTASRP